MQALATTHTLPQVLVHFAADAQLPIMRSIMHTWLAKPLDAAANQAAVLARSNEGARRFSPGGGKMRNQKPGRDRRSSAQARPGF